MRKTDYLMKLLRQPSVTTPVADNAEVMVPLS